jgi:hypothetical protein
MGQAEQNGHSLFPPGFRPPRRFGLPLLFSIIAFCGWLQLLGYAWYEILGIVLAAGAGLVAILWGTYRLISRHPGSRQRGDTRG